LRGISVLIRNYNEAQYLTRTLESVRNQRYNGQIEIVFVDSGSTDKSIEVAYSYDCKVIKIDKEDFTYGKALNLGMRNCSFDWVVILSSHCVLFNEDFLSRVSKNFGNPRLAAIRCEPITSKRFLEPLNLQEVSNPKYDQKFILDYWDKLICNACSVINRKVWLQLPFDENIEFAEDKKWNLDVFVLGYSLVIGEDLYYYYSRDNKNRYIKREFQSEIVYRKLFRKKRMNVYRLGFHYLLSSIKALKNMFIVFLNYLSNYRKLRI
jgi:rhamnosyltransferase